MDFLFSPTAICHSTLNEALSTSLWKLILGSWLALLGIWGWGLLIEFIFFKSNRERPSLSHAFLEGLVIVSGLRCLTSILGLCDSSKLIALTGSVLAFMLLPVLWHRIYFQRFQNQPWGIRMFWWVGCGIAAIAQFIFPNQSNDTIAIWAYHAKALTCECLFAADYIREPAWAYSHPEYPLLFPFLHSYFFSLTHSFRDDWVRLWMSCALFPSAWLIVESFIKRSLSTRYLYLALLAYFAFMSHPALDGTVEFAVVIFSLLAFFTIWNENLNRLPIYLLGMAFSKNEGLVGAAVLLGLLGIQALRRREKEYLRPLLTSGFLLGLVVLLLLFLPSRHEQYPLRFTQIEAWKEGLHTLPIILLGWVSYFFHMEPWVYIFPLILLLAPSILRHNAIHRLGCLWTLCMMVIFTVVYIVSPWGPDLYKNTIQRIMFPYFMITLFITIHGIAQHISLTRWRRRIENIIFSIFVLILIVIYSNQLKKNSNQFYDRLIHHSLGQDYYAHASNWPLARQLDARFPVRARITVSAHIEPIFFDLNYMLYPRKFYPGRPDQNIGTWAPWKRWIDKEEALQYGFEYFLDTPF